MISVPRKWQCPKEVNVRDGNRSFPVKVEVDAVPVDFVWVGELLNLNFEPSLEEIDFHPEVSISRRGDGVGGQSEGSRLTADDRGRFNDKPRDKGKNVYVRTPKKIPAFPTCLNGKLVIEKEKRALSSSNTEDSSYESSSAETIEEAREVTLSKYQGECSKFYSKGPKCVGEGDEQPISPSEKGECSSSDSPKTLIIASEACVNGTFSDQLEGPRKLVVSHKEHQSVLFTDLEGRILSIPLKGPIPLPLSGVEGNQISGSDLKELPIMIELETGTTKVVSISSSSRTDRGNGNEQYNSSSSNDKQPNQLMVPYWNLEEEIAKVIEKGVAMGYVFNSKAAEARNQGKKDGVGLQGNSGILRNNQNVSLGNKWDLDDEVAKVIEAGEKGKEKWIQKLKLKPTLIPTSKGGISIGAVGSDQYFPSSSEDTSSSRDEPARRGVFRKGVGECSKVNGPPSPKVYRLEKNRAMSVLKPCNGQRENGLKTGPIRGVFDSSNQEGFVNIVLEEGEVSSPSNDSFQRRTKKGVHCVKESTFQVRDSF
ncbi:hypothetical protein LWI29_029289 [Acer saccharum]|uniref:Uncharacterized protein n=1 Tax=Acer saccharum TaxID=4024 RepID=A0AA39SP95_ACESA|nr:hypothetical protein LWI29_029289 [Acer saccharum]